MVKGFCFRVSWAATGLTETVNATSLEMAERKMARKYRTACALQFLGETAPIPPDRWAAAMPQRVF